MKERLQRILSVLCVLALALGCMSVSALAENLKVVTVIWNDGNDAEGLRPASLGVHLGTADPVTLNEDNGWITYLSGEDGSALVVDDVPQGYVKTVSDEDQDIIRVTMTHVPRYVEGGVTAKVEWVDDGNKKHVRPGEVTLRLLADGIPCRPAARANASNNWSVTWNDLPAFRKGSVDEKIVYTVQQASTAALSQNYETSVDGLTVTNTELYGRLQISMEISGAPEDADLSKLQIRVTGPDITMPVFLGYSDVLRGSVTLDQLVPGTYLVEDMNGDTLVPGYLLKTDKATRVVDAGLVKANPVNETDQNVTQLKYNFVYVLPEAVKTGDMPEPATYQGNLEFEIIGPVGFEPVRIRYADFKDGRYELNDLQPGSYTVVERNAETLVDIFHLRSDSVAGMSLMVTANGTATASLFNHYVPYVKPAPNAETVDIPVVKVWNDNSNQDGNRPAEVTVRLYANGAQVDTAALNDGNGWQYTFTEKPRYDEYGKELEYSITEDAVPMYRVVIRDFAITNEYEPELVSASVSKIWNDDGNASGQRPFSLAMSLSDGYSVVAIVVLSDQNGWTATVNNLPAIKNGQRVTYTWTEQESLGYYLATKAEDGNNAVFTNASWERPPVEEAKVPKKAPGNAFYIFEDYETPLGVEIMINHVGDCFD